MRLYTPQQQSDIASAQQQTEAAISPSFIGTAWDTVTAADASVGRGLSSLGKATVGGFNSAVQSTGIPKLFSLSRNDVKNRNGVATAPMTPAAPEQKPFQWLAGMQQNPAQMAGADTALPTPNLAGAVGADPMNTTPPPLPGALSAQLSANTSRNWEQSQLPALQGHGKMITGSDGQPMWQRGSADVANPNMTIGPSRKMSNDEVIAHMDQYNKAHASPQPQESLIKFNNVDANLANLGPKASTTKNFLPNGGGLRQDYGSLQPQMNRQDVSASLITMPRG
jgi:hypothetical protein